jgi:putative ABC transport system permease protein
VSWLRGLHYRISRRLWSSKRERGFVSEIEFHIDMEAAKYVANGMSSTEARKMAERHFGNLARLGDDLRDERGDGLAGELIADLRFAWRSIRRSPGVTAIVALTFALGIGANSAVFTVVDAVVLRPLPLPHAEQLVHIRAVNPKEPGVTTLSYLDVRDYAAAKSIRSAGAYVARNVTLVAQADPIRLEAIAVTGSFFDALAKRPHLGRFIIEDDTHANSPSVVVLSYGLWREQFGGDATVVGRLVRLSGRQFEVVGVMPEEFSFPERARLWIPYRPTVYDLSESGRGNHDYAMIARLVAGTSVESATRELQLIATRLARSFPTTSADYSVRAESLQDFVVGPVRAPLLLLMGAVISILLIACANVANLLLARATGRSDEYAIRGALGAGPGRLIRLLVVEAFALTAIGGAGGLFVAWAGARALAATQPRDIPRVSAIGVDARVLVFTSFVIAACTLLVAVLPALRASRASMYSLLREDSRGSAGRGQGRARQLLVVAETALAAMLLVGASLFLHSFMNLRRVDTGFRAPTALTFGLTLPSASYDDARVRAFYRQLFERINHIPGVKASGAVSLLPLSRSMMLLPFHVEGAAPRPDSLALISVMAATPGYFDAMGIDMISGHSMEDHADDAPQSVILSEAAVRLGLHERPPLTTDIRVGWTWNGKTPIGGRIAGVARNVRASILEDARPTVYVEHTAAPLSTMNVVVRVDRAPEQYVAPIRTILRTMDANVAMAHIQTTEQLFAEATAQPRFYTTLIALFAVIAAVLAILGLFGVITYTVALRTREIGIRMALGANASTVARVVLSQGVALGGAGIAVGLVAAFVFSRVLNGLLFNVSGGDPAAYAATAALLGLAAAIGAALPAFRAARVDPVVALRTDRA